MVLVMYGLISVFVASAQYQHLWDLLFHYCSLSVFSVWWFHITFP